jgi:hypothetical protein
VSKGLSDLKKKTKLKKRKISITIEEIQDTNFSEESLPRISGSKERKTFQNNWNTSL